MNKQISKLLKNAQKLVASLEKQGFEVSQSIKERIANPRLSGKGIAQTKKMLSARNIREQARYYRKVDGKKVGYAIFTAAGGDIYTQMARQIVKDARKIANPKTIINGRKTDVPRYTAPISMNLMQLERDTGIKFLKGYKSVKDLPNLKVDYKQFAKALKASEGYYTQNLLEATIHNPVMTREGNKKLLAEAKQKGIQTIMKSMDNTLDTDYEGNILGFDDMTTDFLNSVEWQTYAERMYFYEAMEVEATIRVEQNKNNLDVDKADNTFESYFPDQRRHTVSYGWDNIFRGYANMYGFFK